MAKLYQHLIRLISLFQNKYVVKMKLLVVIAVCVVITAAVPIDSNSTEEQQNDLNSVNEDSNAESADRSKRFIFFKWFYPYPVYAAPVKGKWIGPPSKTFIDFF